MKKTRLLTLSISILIAGGAFANVVINKNSNKLLPITTPTIARVDPPMP